MDEELDLHSCSTMTAFGRGLALIYAGHQNSAYSIMDPWVPLLKASPTSLLVPLLPDLVAQSPHRRSGAILRPPCSSCSLPRKSNGYVLNSHACLYRVEGTVTLRSRCHVEHGPF